MPVVPELGRLKQDDRECEVSLATQKKGGAGHRDGLAVRLLAGLPEDPSSVPRTHVKWLTTACNSSSRGIRRPLLDSVGTALVCTPTHTEGHIYTCIQFF